MISMMRFRSDNPGEDDCAADRRLLGVGLSPAEAALLLDCEPIVLHRQSWDLLFDLGALGPTDEGIPRRAMASDAFFSALSVATVVFLQGSERFAFTSEVRDQTGAEIVVIVPAIDMWGNVEDLVAWRVADNKTASWRGAAGYLGEHETLLAPQIEFEGVRVFGAVAEWLRSGRQGVFIVNRRIARLRLDGVTFVVDSIAAGDRLDAMMRAPPPRILVDERKVLT
jgi:hypothetical protein